jgi:hypothetical protein
MKSGKYGKSAVNNSNFQNLIFMFYPPIHALNREDSNILGQICFI